MGALFGTTRRKASVKEAASEGAQSTLENCFVYRNLGSSVRRETAPFASLYRPSFTNGAASSMYELPNFGLCWIALWSHLPPPHSGQDGNVRARAHDRRKISKDRMG